MLENYIGQTKIKTTLNSLLTCCKESDMPVPHLLITGKSGTGKSELAKNIAKDLNRQFITIMCPKLKSEELVKSILNCDNNSIAFLDEIQSLDSKLCDMLLPVLNDNKLYTNYRGESVCLELPKITFIGATTHEGMLPVALRNRFTITLSLIPYTQEELTEMICKSLKCKEVTEEAINVIIQMGRHIPRSILNIVRTVNTIAQYSKRDTVNLELLEEVSNLVGVDFNGLSYNDYEILKYLNKNDSASAKTLADVLEVEEINITERYEPYLLKLGLIEKTSKGRKITEIGRSYLK